jgi:general secretion pathway protein G
MRKQKGFTLIELVVVVMILGILAAVAAPKLLNTSGTAADNALKQTLGVVRDAIERYAAEHSGSLPPDMPTLVTQNYIRGAFPKCPVGTAAGLATIATSTQTGVTTAGGPEAWRYNTADGTFICNSTDPSKIDSSIHYNEF